MKLPVKAICENKFLRRDGTAIIFIQCCFTSEKRILLNTELDEKIIQPLYRQSEAKTVL